MPSWNELIKEIDKIKKDELLTAWINNKRADCINAISELRGGRNVIFYASAFLQKPIIPSVNLQITAEEINGLMTVMHGMDWSKQLCLILHTPGGSINAAETIVSYLFSKFNDIEVIVPTYAMSAGTMISLAANKIIMGRQSQLGPFDPQLHIGGGRIVPAAAVVDQFESARRDIAQNIQSAHLWAPILQSIGPALLQEAKNSIKYSQKIVQEWLEKRMFNSFSDKEELANKVADYFKQASIHLSHGKRIDRDEARSQGLIVEDLEDNQELQEQVLTLYHLMTIIFEKSPATKTLLGSNDKVWVKNAPMPPQQNIPNPNPNLSFKKKKKRR